jgi:hypothetical protein
MTSLKMPLGLSQMMPLLVLLNGRLGFFIAICMSTSLRALMQSRNLIDGLWLGSFSFWHSDLEYEWPRHPFDGGVGVIARLLSYVLSFGVNPRKVDKKWKATGHFDVWPFIRRKDEEALTDPKLLRGRAA